MVLRCHYEFLRRNLSNTLVGLWHGLKGLSSWEVIHVQTEMLSSLLTSDWVLNVLWPSHPYLCKVFCAGSLQRRQCEVMLLWVCAVDDTKNQHCLSEYLKIKTLYGWLGSCCSIFRNLEYVSDGMTVSMSKYYSSSWHASPVGLTNCIIKKHFLKMIYVFLGTSLSGWCSLIFPNS